MARIITYFVIIVLVAAIYLLVRGHSGLTGRNVLVAIPLALLMSALIWYRWDVVAPRMRARREVKRVD